MNELQKKKKTQEYRFRIAKSKHSIIIEADNWVHARYLFNKHFNVKK